MKVKDVQHGKTTRKSFARIEEILEMPNLIEVQKKSYEWFLAEGLREVFADAASITDYTGNLELSFLDYSMDEEPKYSIEECKARDATYATPLKVRSASAQQGDGRDQGAGDLHGRLPEDDRLRAPSSSTAQSAQSYLSSSVPRACTTARSSTRPTRSCSPPPLSRTAAHGSSTRPMQTTFSMSASTRTARFRSPAFIRAIGVKTDAEIKELFGEDPLLRRDPRQGPGAQRGRGPHRDLQEDASGRAALCRVGDLPHGRDVLRYAPLRHFRSRPLQVQQEARHRAPHHRPQAARDRRRPDDRRGAVAEADDQC